MTLKTLFLCVEELELFVTKAAKEHKYTFQSLKSGHLH